MLHAVKRGGSNHPYSSADDHQARPRRQSRLQRAVSQAVERLEPRRLMSTAVLSYHNDLASTGVNNTETLLTPSTVNVTQFQKQYSVPVDGEIYGQPLYDPGVNITSGSQPGIHNVAYVVTQHDSLYAIDTNGGSVLWRTSFLDSTNPQVNLLGATSITTVPSSDTNSTDIVPEVGITGTPVIDPSTNMLYLTAKTKQTVGGFTHYVYDLYKVNIQSGQIAGSTIVGDTINSGGTYIYRVSNTGTGTDPYVNGTGDGSITGQAAFAGQPAASFGQSRVYFNAMRAMDRPGVTLVNGSIYIAFASHGDNGPYHGWVFRYDPATLTLNGALNTTPNGGLGGLWMAGNVLVADAAGNLYAETGNGSFNTSASNFPNGQYFPADHDYGDCFIKISADPTHTSESSQNPNGFGLQISDYFSPYNNAVLNGGDTDLGSGGPVVLPDAVGSTAHPHLLVGAGKEGRIYLVDRDHMGGFNASTDQVVAEETFTTNASGTGGSGINGSLNTPGFFLNGANGTSGTLYYFPGYGGNGRSFTITNATISAASTSQTTDTFGQLDGTPSISANGTTNGIVWVVDRGSNALRAYDATNLAHELWTSNSASNGRDALGPATKFEVPTVADGRVFVGTANTTTPSLSALVVYGPPTPPTSGPNNPPSGLAAAAPNFNTVNLTWQDNSNNEDGFLIERSTDGMTWAQISKVSANATTYTDTTALATTQYYYRVRAYNSFGGTSYSDYSNVATVTTPQAPPMGTGDGLLGQYYLDQQSGGGHLQGTPAYTHTDPSINFNWNGASPAPGIGGTNFSVKWTGSFQPQTTQTYTFHTTSDDGVRLYVNGQLLINDWNDHAPTDDYAAMALTKGTTYTFEMDFYQNQGGSEALLHWSSPTIADTPIPLLNGGALGQYFNDTPSNGYTHLQGTPVLTRVDPKVDSSTWANGAPAPSVGNSYFSVKWTGKVQPQYSEAYTFYTESDDGVMLFVNGQQLVNDWNDHGSTEDSGTITLSAGQEYAIEMDYYEAGPPDVAQLLWSSPSTPKELIPQSQLYSGVAPAAPTNLAATPASGTQFNLSWTDNSNNETGFDLERAVGNGAFQPVTGSPLPPNTTSYIDTGLTPGQTYTYEIRALNFGANSAYTAPLTVTAPTPPTKPSGNHATFNSTNEIDIAWTDNSNNEDGFRVLRQAPGQDAFVIATLGPNVTSYKDKGPNGAGLTPGTEYEYHVQAFNIAGYNDFSGTDTATLTLPPAALTAAAGAGQVTLNWTPPSYNADNSTLLTFNVYRGTTPGGEGATPIATGLTSPTYTDTGLTAGQPYYYTVTAVEVGGESAPSAEATATPTSAAAPTALQSLTINDGSAQRSEVRSVTLAFAQPVTLAAGDVSLSLLNTGGSGTNDGSAATNASAALGTPTTSDGGLTWVIPILANTAYSDATGSLSDGIYTLGLLNPSVTAGSVSTTFHRLFGDINGDGQVSNADYFLFRKAFNTSSGDANYNAAFDFNGDGQITNADYFQFRKRFLMAYTY